jgi:AraC-like DNA-binding protein
MKNLNKLKDFTTHGTPQLPLHIYNQYYEHGGLTVPYHWHEEIELIYVEEGSMEMTINTTTKHVYKNEFFCINSQELHQIYSIGRTSSIHHALVFSPDILSFEYFDDSQSRFIHPLLNHTLLLPQVICTDKPYGQEILRLFLEILEVNKVKKTGWYLNVKACLYKILSILAGEDLLITMTNNLKNLDYKMEQVKKAIAYIHENFTKKIYITELAKVVSMNPQYFCRFFKSMVNKTPIEYINNYRINRANKYLQSEDLSVMEVCLRVGFENPSYFIKLFKEQNNMTPLEYKNVFLKI